MSVLSFKVFCIELYAEHKGMNSADVYDLFERRGLLDLLDTDYENVHGISHAIL